MPKTKKPHAREHRLRPQRTSLNLNQVLTFINSAGRHELYAIRIAMQQRPNWMLATKGGTRGN